MLTLTGREQLGCSSFEVKYSKLGFCWVFLKTLRGNQDERIIHELREWERNYTDVQQIMDDLVLARGRNQALKEEVSEHH